MTLFVLFLVLYYVLITGSMLAFLPSLPVIVLASVFYLLPLLLHSWLLVKCKSKEELLKYGITLPVLSMVSYTAFAYFSENLGLWQLFVERNTVVSDEMTVQIAQSPMELSQLAFAFILYSSISVVHYYIKLQKIKKEITHAYH